MKVVQVKQFGGPEVLRITALPDPVAQEHEIVIDVQAVGINPVDAYIRTGQYALRPALPYVPGMDASGIVSAVGKNVRFWKPGDRVYTIGILQGAYAEKICCQDCQACALPATYSFAEGAAIGVPYATAFRALLQKAQADRGETLLVHGASGGVGIAAVQIAKLSGLRIIGTAGTTAGLDLLRQQGVDHALNHREEGYFNSILTLTEQKGVDIILEMLANVNLGKDLRVLARNGRVVVIGNRGSVEINPRDIMAREAVVTGVVLLSTPPEELRTIHQHLSVWLHQNLIRPVVGKTFSLAEAAKAHEAVMSSGAFGKIVLLPSLDKV